MDFAFALGLGLLGSFHCAAMCGPLQLALPIPPGGPGRVVAGRLIYQLGRIASYCFLGLVAGLVGKTVIFAGFQRWLSICLGILILTGFFLSKRVALSAPVARLVNRLKTAMGSQLRRRGWRALAVLGALNGFLPCGLVYVAMAAAVAYGSVASGILFMATFGLGTTPTLLAISLFGRVLPLNVRLKLRTAIPLGVCLLAAMLILRGMSLGIPYVSPDLSGAGSGCCHVP